MGGDAAAHERDHHNQRAVRVGPCGLAVNASLANAPNKSDLLRPAPLASPIPLAMRSLGRDDFSAPSYIPTDKPALNPRMEREYLVCAVEQDALGVDAVLSRLPREPGKAGETCSKVSATDLCPTLLSHLSFCFLLKYQKTKHLLGLFDEVPDVPFCPP